MNLLSIASWAVWLIVIVVIVLVVGIIIWAISTRNSLVALQNNVEEGFSTIDVYLKKRWDLIPNLVETVKGYAAHEQGTFTKVIEARNKAMSATTAEEKIAAENALTGTLKSLFALKEAYPDLKANQQFSMLQSQLTSIENDIAQHRKYYNATVKQFNNKIMFFPSSIIANSMKLTKKPYFEADASERQNVQVKF
ncbi:MAG: LemA family protein [Clostridiales bacterium]|nr:LemA family protein [Clostridiales bacterium]